MSEVNCDNCANQGVLYKHDEDYCYYCKHNYDHADLFTPKPTDQEPTAEDIGKGIHECCEQLNNVGPDGGDSMHLLYNTIAKLRDIANYARRIEGES